MGWTYALPFVGKYAYQYDRIKDLSQMQKDYTKNTGKKVKYQTNSYQTQAYNGMRSFAEDAIHDVGKLARWL